MADVELEEKNTRITLNVLAFVTYRSTAIYQQSSLLSLLSS